MSASRATGLKCSGDAVNLFACSPLDFTGLFAARQKVPQYAAATILVGTGYSAPTEGQ